MIRRFFSPRNRDRWFFWKVGIKSKLLRLRCVLLGGHTHSWMPMHGGGEGMDAHMCQRCRCHVAAYRDSITKLPLATEKRGG